MAKLMKKLNKATKKVQTETREDMEGVNGSSVILRDVEVLFWSDKPISNNPRYEKQYVLSIRLEKKHLALLDNAKEHALERWMSENDETEIPDYQDKIYEDDKGKSLTFRSNDDFKELTEYQEEMLDTDIRVGAGTKINIAINSWVYESNRRVGITYYANGINITELVERSNGFDLRAALR